MADQLPLFTEPSVTGICPECGRELRWIYTSDAPPPPPWDQVPGADWSHGANWGVCDCSPSVARACRPVEAPRVAMTARSAPADTEDPAGADSEVDDAVSGRGGGLDAGFHDFRRGRSELRLSGGEVGLPRQGTAGHRSHERGPDDAGHGPVRAPGGRGRDAERIPHTSNLRDPDGSVQSHHGGSD